MKVVVDTNVFMSGVFFTGPPYQILEAWRNRLLELVLSPEILDEYRRVALELSNKYPSVDIAPFLELAVKEGYMVSPKPLPDKVCEDADDDKFIACALAAACDMIVSGDKHLLKASGFRGISVLKPREFVRRHL